MYIGKACSAAVHQSLHAHIFIIYIYMYIYIYIYYFVYVCVYCFIHVLFYQPMMHLQMLNGCMPG